MGFGSGNYSAFAGRLGFFWGKMFFWGIILSMFQSLQNEVRTDFWVVVGVLVAKP